MNKYLDFVLQKTHLGTKGGKRREILGKGPPVELVAEARVGVGSGTLARNVAGGSGVLAGVPLGSGLD